MTPNVGSTDRLLRIGLGLLLLGLTATQAIGLWGLVGIVPVATGFMRFCPAYRLFGIQTCPKP